jgi:glyoxylase-like metal-dependent hydrolase (beta-lactamase superfamily II)
MAVGDRIQVPGDPACTFVDTGMYGTPNYGGGYILDAERPAIVETGIGADYESLLAAAAEAGIDRADLAAVVVTHVHLDHAGGAGLLAAACPNADVYVHEAGAQHLADPSRLVAGTKRAVGDMWEFYADPEPVPETRIVDLADGDGIDLGDRTLTARACPGHAPHQVVFGDSATGNVFVGDAAGIWIPPCEEVVPTTPPPQFDLETALADLDTVRSLSPERLLFTHFGPGPGRPAALLDEYAEALRDWLATVEAAHTDRTDEAVIEHFGAEYQERFADVWGERKAREEGRLNTRGALAALDG